MMLLWLTALVSLLLGFAAKVAADTFLDEHVALIGSWVGLRYSLNPGIAFGVRLPDLLQLPLILLALAIVIAVARSSAKTMLSRIGFGLIIGGACGNILDRARDGFVTDYVQVGSFPIFNLPDSCITVGVGLLLLEMLLPWMGFGKAQKGDI